MNSNRSGTCREGRDASSWDRDELYGTAELSEHVTVVACPSVQVPMAEVVLPTDVIKQSMTSPTSMTPVSAFALHQVGSTQWLNGMHACMRSRTYAQGALTFTDTVVFY